MARTPTTTPTDHDPVAAPSGPSADTSWTAPPGSWTSAADHVPAAVTAEFEHVYLPARERAFRDLFRRYGVPADTYEGVFVHGRLYDRVRPIVGGDKDAKLPPAFVLKAVTRVHPEFRRRTRAMTETLRIRRWREDATRWHDEWRPAFERRNLELADIDPSSLDDDGLARHLVEVEQHADRGIEVHFALKGLDSLPLGDLLALTRRHGTDPRRVVDAFRGLSPASRPPASLLAVADAVRTAGVDAHHLVSLEDVRAVSPAASEALDEHLRHHGARLLSGYDVAGPTVAERPALLVAAIRSLVDHQLTAPDRVGIDDEALAAIRSSLPADVHEDFDRRVTEAAVGYPVRDDNGPLTFQWPVGLLRRAMVAAGQRLVERGRLHGPEHAVDLTVAELAGILRGGAGPTAEDAASRARRRDERSRLEPPTTLGPPDATPPLAVLPAPLARAVDAVDTFIATMVGASGSPDTRRPLEGDGVGGATYVGRAVVAADAEDALLRIEPGCVLVTTMTTPAFNAALFLAGAVVTEEGGLLSHAALIARETGIVAVVGAGGATRLIDDGDEVEVDPTSGTVRVLTPTG